MGILDAPSVTPAALAIAPELGIPNGQLLRWYAALGQQATTPAGILCAGHSMMGGYITNNHRSQLHMKLASKIRKRLGLGGGATWIPVIRTGYTFTDYPITYTSPLAGTGFGMPANSSGFVKTGVNGPIVLAVPAGTTSVGIWSADTSTAGGTFTYAIDAGSTTGVTTGTSAYDFKRETLVAMPDANAHTLTIAGGAAYALIDGFMLYAGDETSGIRAYNITAPGSTTAQILTNNVPFYTNSANGSSIRHLNPALLVVTAMCNDYMTSGGTAGANPNTVAGSISNLNTIIETLAGQCLTRPSIVFCIEHQIRNIDSQMTQQWAQYVTAAKAMCKANGYLPFDLGARWGNQPPAAGLAAGLIYVDTIHPTDVGFDYWADALATAVMPR